MALVATLLVAPVWAADEAAESCCKSRKARASKQSAATSKLRCSLTGTVVDSCCCIQRGGKLYCPLAGRNVETCCCESTATRGKDSEDESKQSAPEATTRR